MLRPIASSACGTRIPTFAPIARCFRAFSGLRPLPSFIGLRSGVAVFALTAPPTGAEPEPRVDIRKDGLSCACCPRGCACGAARAAPRAARSRRSRLRAATARWSREAWLSEGAMQAWAWAARPTKRSVQPVQIFIALLKDRHTEAHCYELVTATKRHNEPTEQMSISTP